MPRNIADWGALGQGIQGMAQQAMARRQQQQELQQALQKLMREAQVKQQIEQQDPYKQLLNKIMAQSFGIGGDSQQSLQVNQGNVTQQVPNQQMLVGNQRWKPSLRLGSTGPTITMEENRPDINALKFNVEQENKRKLDEAQSKSVVDSALDSLDTITEVEKGINYFGAGALFPAIPSAQPAKLKWQANLNKLLAGKIINVMNEMKRVSRTGATGFGQLNRSELKVLQDASTALKKTMSPKDAQAILNKMKIPLQKIAQVESIGSEIQGEVEQDSQQQPSNRLNAIKSKWGL